MAENILFFCAHNDDQIIGAGGTISKYTKEGKNVITVIFSHGEMTHPWLKPRHIIKTREKEAISSNKILGGSELVFLDLKEGKYKEQYKDGGLELEMMELMKKTKPSKIFLHSSDDPHPDHRAVYNIVNELLDRTNYKGDSYMFDIWTPLVVRQRNRPKMVVDITKTFKTKLNAFKMHKSQKMALMSLLWSVYLKAFLNGINNGCKYAEVFTS